MDKKEQWISIQKQNPELAKSMKEKTDNGMSLLLAEVNKHFTVGKIVISKKSTGG